MGVIDKVKNILTASRAREVFGVRSVSSSEMERLLARCANVYQGRPDWTDADPENAIKTVNFARSICAETARLTTLGISVAVSGSARGDWLQQQVDGFYWSLRRWAELGCAYGAVILKPNGEDVDVLTPDRFVVTDAENGEITGAVFISWAYRQDTERYYTRLEYHRFADDGTYRVTNRCFVGVSSQDRGRAVAIEATPWAGLEEETVLENVERPLFGVFRTPAVGLDPDSPLGMPVFADALEELRDLDVAYSRNAAEIYDSNRLTLVDDRLTEQAGAKIGSGTSRVRLPRFVRKVFGASPEEYYQEINPALNTEARMAGINALLSQIGFKCGFSNGYFVFNERSGTMTATQVEADDRRTIQLIKDMRDRLEAALDGVLYALDVFADLYGYAPAGEYETNYSFGDLTYNFEEDRARNWGYVVSGKYPMYAYLMRFEGYTEEEAKKLVAEAGARTELPFGPEE